MALCCVHREGQALLFSPSPIIIIIFLSVLDPPAFLEPKSAAPTAPSPTPAAPLSRSEEGKP